MSNNEWREVSRGRSTTVTIGAVGRTELLGDTSNEGNRKWV
ncbi:hypothetical protein [Butyrivibrio sp. MB2005]|nr:hypothetical protein [Butyrivibrio sp. MB2005]